LCLFDGGIEINEEHRCFARYWNSNKTNFVIEACSVSHELMLSAKERDFIAKHA
jgi:hypothetical protein